MTGRRPNSRTLRSATGIFGNAAASASGQDGAFRGQCFEESQSFALATVSFEGSLVKSRLHYDNSISISPGIVDADSQSRSIFSTLRISRLTSFTAMDNLIYVQGNEASSLTPLILIHAVSGLALPYLALGPLTDGAENEFHTSDRAVYGINSPIYSSKDYRPPRSFDEVARQYISLIKKELQPNGPYLLGGWSFGGMIALKMASLLEAEGESVIRVIMIDSANPENYPPFVNRAEHEKIATLTYSGIARNLSVSDPINDSEDGSGLESSDDEESSNLSSLLAIMRKHVFNSLNIMSATTCDSFIREYYARPVTLIKCSLPSRSLPSLRDTRRAFMHKVFHDEHMGWQATRFKDFQTLHFKAQHDSALDDKHVGELTTILRAVLAHVP